MIRSKNSCGFTLIEVVLAVAIMAAILTPLFISEGAALLCVGRFSEAYRRIVAARSYLCVARRDEQAKKKTAPRTLAEPPVTLTYVCEKAAGTIGTKFKDMRRQLVKIEWTEDSRKKSDLLVSFAFVPSEQSENQP